MEKRKIPNFMKITSGNEQLIALPASEVQKLQQAFEQLESGLAEGKTCCDFCCDWCNFTIDWMEGQFDLNKVRMGPKIDLIKGK